MISMIIVISGCVPDNQPKMTRADNFCCVPLHASQKAVFCFHSGQRRLPVPAQYRQGEPSSFSNRISPGCELKKFRVVHLLVRQIFPVIKERVCCNGCRRIPGFLPALEPDGPEGNLMLLCRLFHDGDILCVERALVRVVQDISLPVRAGMPCTVLKPRLPGFGGKRKRPELDPVVRFI